MLCCPSDFRPTKKIWRAQPLWGGLHSFSILQAKLSGTFSGDSPVRPGLTSTYRVVHAGLIIKLIARGIPLAFIDVIILWYDGLACRVKWGDTLSEWFSVTAGVRQGGVLSPDLYCLYVDDLILKIKDTQKGCYFACIFAAALFYADDMALLSPSIKGLTILLNMCEEYCQEWDICLNSKKSRLMYFGKRTEVLSDISLNNEHVKWASEWTYLGVVLKSDLQFSCSITERIRKLYRCTNAIFRIDGKSTDTVMLHLVEWMQFLRMQLK